MKTQQSKTEVDMLPEYDFSGKKGVRGKYYHAYQQGHMVKIHQEDGNVIIQCFTGGSELPTRSTSQPSSEYPVCLTRDD